MISELESVRKRLYAHSWALRQMEEEQAGTQANQEALQSLKMGFFNEHRKRFEQLRAMSSGKETWEEYQSSLEYLKDSFIHLSNCLAKPQIYPQWELNIKETLFKQTLYASNQLIKNVVIYLEKQGEDSQREGLSFLAPLQKILEEKLDQLMPLRKKNFELDLSGLREAYEQAYQDNYGQGYFGFFTLPFKRFLRQKARERELNFLEEVESYLQKNSPQLSEEVQGLIRLGAANFIREHIQTERFAQGSILYRLLERRLADVGLCANKDLNTTFQECLADERFPSPPYSLAQEKKGLSLNR